MGYRVRICRKTAENIEENGRVVGERITILHSQKQDVWFNNDSSQLADWLNTYCVDTVIPEEREDWEVWVEDLKHFPQEAFADNEIQGYTGDELRRFTEECIAMANKDGWVHLEWF